VGPWAHSVKAGTTAAWTTFSRPMSPPSDLEVSIRWSPGLSVPGKARLPEDSATPWFPRGRGIRASGRLCPAHGQSQSDVEVDSKALPRSSMPSEPWRWRTPSFRIYAPPGCHGQGGRRNAATSRLKARVRSVPTAISSVWRFGKHWQGKAHVKPGPEQKPQTRAGCSGCGWGAPQVNAAVNGVAANGSDLVGAEF